MFAIQIITLKAMFKQTIIKYLKQIYCGFFKKALFRNIYLEV